jgi:DNA-binding NarL/FixJ family response regulator
MERINLKVMLAEDDFYAARAINSYLAWDRRTRVIGLYERVEAVFEAIANLAEPEYPDVLVFDELLTTSTGALEGLIRRFQGMVPDLIVIVLAHEARAEWVEAAFKGGAQAYYVRNEVRLLLPNSIIYATKHRFAVTRSVLGVARPPFNTWQPHAQILPPQREYPEMSERIRQALWLCVVEGMPAQLAADEMGISPNTVRSYIKEGYRILEAYDHRADYPDDMSPLERAFLRFTALETPDSKGG